MKPHNILWVFNWLSVSFGIGIFLDNNCKRLVNGINLIAVCSSYIYIIYILFCTPPEWENDRVLWILLNLFYYLCEIFYTIIFCLKKNDFIIFIEATFGILDKKQQKSVKNVSMILIAVFFAHFTFYTSCYILSQEKIGTLGVIWSIFVIYQNGVIAVHGLFLYLLMAMMLYYSHLNKLDEILFSIQSNENVSMSSHCHDLLLIRCKAKKYSNITGFIIIINLFNIYVEAPSIFFFIVYVREQTFSLFSESASILFYVIMILVVISLVQMFQGKCEDRRTQILREVLSRRKISNRRHIFLELLREKDLFALTATDLFNIDYKMLMCFAASLVSYTVLIIQLGKK